MFRFPRFAPHFTLKFAPKFVLVLSSFVFFLLAARAQSGSAPAVGRFAGAPFSSTVADIRAASAAVPADRDDYVQILLEEGTYTFAADGTLIYTYRTIYRIDNKDAIEGWSEFSMQWDPWYEKPSQLHARVLQADGTFVELDQKTVTDAPVKGDDDETFSSEHVRRAPLPGMAVGSIVEESGVVEEKTPYFAAGGLYRFQFRNNVPTAFSRLTIELPEASPFVDSVQNLPNVVIDRKVADGRRHVVYEQGQLTARHDSDIDLWTNAPSAPIVEFATGKSWGSIAAAYAAMSDPNTIVDDARPILPADLPADRTARINAIVAKLHKEVRYTGVEFGAAKLTPQLPAEVIRRHYGDCKDKATLLVAMLRAAGISADLALLSTGPGRDVTAALPGISKFNHAIVYVPAAGKDAAIWIDATAQYFAAGSLPYDDQGRMALVIAPETTGLTRTSDPKQQDSQVVETRLFTLSEHGPAHVVETSNTLGRIDANYRSLYGGTDSKKIHDDLESYVKSAYLAKSLVRVDHGPADDLSKPFDLTIEAADAKRGTTAMDEAVVAIFPTMVLGDLPNWFAKAPVVVGPDTSETEKHEMELAKASRQATYVFHPYLDERRVRIVIPDGFALRSLPPNKTTQIGLGSLTEEYSAAEKGIITATYKFDSGPGTLTADQALAMRDAVLALNKREYVGVYFDQTGAKALEDGHIRAALEADRAMIDAHPKDALPHVRLARALLSAGIGDESHTEAKRAVELDPKLSTAFDTLGWTLQHDSLGVRFGKGFDRAGSIAAYEKAITLDAEADDSYYDLAILNEFDARGTRYAEDASMPKAIDMYRALIEKTKDKNPAMADQYRENMMYDLIYSRRFKELDEMLTSLSFSNSRGAVMIASVTAQHGAEAGIAQSAKGNVAASDRLKNLNSAGTILSRMRLYPEASAILQAGMGGGADAATTARQVEMYKDMKPASLAPLPASDPAGPVQRITIATLSGTLTAAVVKDNVSRHAYSSEKSLNMDVEKGLQTAGELKAVAEKSGVTEAVLLDIVIGNMTFTATGDKDAGYAVLVSSPGSEAQHTFVVYEDGGYRMIGDDSDTRELGNAVLYALEQKKPKLAKAMLDWKRDLTHKKGGDDAFAGPLLPLFWTVDSPKPGADSPEAMRLAAVSLLAGSIDAKPYLAEVAAAREKASGQRQTDLDLLLASAAIGAEDAAMALPAAKRLLEQEPDSITALSLAGEAYAFQKDSADWLAMLKPLLARHAKDRDLLTQQIRAYAVGDDFSSARKSEQAIMDSGKATSSDYNLFAWLGLFDNHVGEPELKAAQQSNMLSKNGSFADLHTLACIYAVEGKTTEARQVLTQAMDASSQTTPDAAVWYALGLIYEQYGAKEAALTAYGKVNAHEFDDHTYVDPTSSYVLAQARIHALTATK